VNENAYKVDLRGEHNISSTFNVSDVSFFDVGDSKVDSRTNPLYGGEDDGNKGVDPNLKDFGGQALRVDGPMTRSKKKRLEEFATSIMFGEHLEEFGVFNSTFNNFSVKICNK
jgi:hypothetical protein